MRKRLGGAVARRRRSWGGYSCKCLAGGAAGFAVCAGTGGSTRAAGPTYTLVQLGHLGVFPLTGATDSGAQGVNGLGTAVGFASKYSATGYLGSRALRWDPGQVAATVVADLDSNKSGFSNSFAYAINASGTAAGYSDVYDAASGFSMGARAVRWDAGGTAVTGLGHLGLSENGDTSAIAYCIDSGGNVFDRGDGKESRGDVAGGRDGDCGSERHDRARERMGFELRLQHQRCGSDRGDGGVRSGWAGSGRA